MQVLGLHGLSGPSLCDCPASLSDVFFSLGLHWIPQYVQSYSLVYFLTIWVSQVHVWHHCHHVFEIFWMKQSRPSPLCPRDNIFSIVTTNGLLSVPLSTSHLHYRRWQSGEIFQVLSTGAFTVLCHVFNGIKEDLLSSFVTFVLVSCPRICLLDVSCLLGLTLLHSAPVCCCHWDSLTRGRLAFEQEAVRGPSLFDRFCTWRHVPGDFRQPSRKCLFKRW